MINVKEAFPNCVEDEKYGWLSGIPRYVDVVEVFGEVLVWCQENNYSGDTLTLIKKDDRLGILQYGWGSCSGCDALYGCDTLEQLQNFVNGLKDSIKWFSREDCIKYLKEHDWQGDSLWYSEDLRKFPVEALKELGVK